MTTLKLFVWDEYAPDYSAGLAFAIAPNIQEAMRMVIESTNGYKHNDWGTCSEYPIDEPIAFSVAGGC